MSTVQTSTTLSPSAHHPAWCDGSTDDGTPHQHAKSFGTVAGLSVTMTQIRRDDGSLTGDLGVDITVDPETGRTLDQQDIYDLMLMLLDVNLTITVVGRCFEV